MMNCSLLVLSAMIIINTPNPSTLRSPSCGGNGGRGWRGAAAALRGPVREPSVITYRRHRAKGPQAEKTLMGIIENHLKAAAVNLAAAFFSVLLLYSNGDMLYVQVWKLGFQLE